MCFLWCMDTVRKQKLVSKQSVQWISLSWANARIEHSAGGEWKEEMRWTERILLEWLGLMRDVRAGGEASTDVLPRGVSARGDVDLRRSGGEERAIVVWRSWNHRSRCFFLWSYCIDWRAFVAFRVAAFKHSSSERVLHTCVRVVDHKVQLATHRRRSPVTYGARVGDVFLNGFSHFHFYLGSWTLTAKYHLSFF